MLTTEDFFTRVLHSEGFICLVGIKNKKVKTLFVNNITEAVETAKEIDKNGFDTYFACATFKTESNRTRENAGKLSTVFVDLDCGIGKPYTDQGEALEALLKFCKEEKINLPLIVNSGGGIHAYWPLEKALSADEWAPVASAFKTFALSKDLHIDPAVTGDAARILRVPESSNYKTAEPRRVSVLAVNNGSFNWIPSKTKSNIFKLNYQTKPDAVTQALIGNIEASFRKILVKTINGEGCEQIKRIATDQASIDEPLWRGGLSIAQFCTDRDIAIHQISMGYHGYSAEETERKASQIKGPYTCETFESLYPEGCKGCPLKGKITSPIQIGKKIKKYTGEAPDSIFAGGEKVNLPKIFPKGYFRGEKGGIYKQIMVGEEPEDYLVYEHDLFVTKRFTDVARGDVVEVHLKLPHDPLRKFLVPMSSLMGKDVSRGIFAERGVALVTKNMDAVVDYIINWANYLEKKEMAEVSREQMGWTPEETFVLGDTEIVPYGPPKYAIPNASTQHVVAAINQKGSLDEWQAIINQVYGREGLEAQAFSLFAGFGAVLFKWTHHDGVILNLLSKISGSGKTTLCYAINSAFGHPKELMMMYDDTKLFKYQRIGVMCNLPVVVDEITNWQPEAASDFAYGITQGRGRHRMKGAANEERANITRWSTIAVTTSNASLYDKIGSIKSMPEGEMYRIFEIFIHNNNQLSKEESDRILYKLAENYGHAGLLFVDFIVKNLKEVKERLQGVRVEFDKAVDMTIAERNWSALMACAFTAGLIVTKDLGLLRDLNLDRVWAYMVNCIKEVRKSTNRMVMSGGNILGQYLNSIIYGNTLIIDSHTDKRSNLMNTPLREPRGELIARIEPDTKLGFIPVGHFRDFCAKKQVPYAEVIKWLVDRKIVVRTERKRMGKGTAISTPPIEALVLDTTHPEFQLDEGLTIETK